MVPTVPLFGEPPRGAFDARTGAQEMAASLDVAW
eukprot:CAMPEP_0119411150 /NCGR_PEP_ID=MMETSP1335-20130426/3964_1 /TAXON_ID=259385 /ORGANISM="Chrysoculter rhomboideus, Strain RCC1486" /LENGTH=33 /DNA_ID= /DNA_START= /DNA_END= /DNA_ORIENTATION=